MLSRLVALSTPSAEPEREQDGRVELAIAKVLHGIQSNCACTNAARFATGDIGSLDFATVTFDPAVRALALHRCTDLGRYVGEFACMRGTLWRYGDHFRISSHHQRNAWRWSVLSGRGEPDRTQSRLQNRGLFTAFLQNWLTINACMEPPIGVSESLQ
jgi:hypothetical protein